jgi:hypothetical protein
MVLLIQVGNVTFVTYHHWWAASTPDPSMWPGWAPVKSGVHSRPKTGPRTWLPILHLPLLSLGTLRSQLHLTEPQFPNLEIEDSYPHIEQQASLGP